MPASPLVHRGRPTAWAGGNRSPSPVKERAASTTHSADLPWIDTAIERALEDTSAFAEQLENLPTLRPLPPGKSRARAVFEHFDVDASGYLGFDEVLLGLRAFGFQTEPDQVRRLFEETDADGSGQIEVAEFGGIVEGVAKLRQGKALDAARLLQAAGALHTQALEEPLVLVAEGEVPTLIKCAGCGHTAVEQLGLSALAAVAEAPQSDCAAAIVARGPALGNVLARLNRDDCEPATVRQGVRLLSALCREAGEAKEEDKRKRIRLKLYELASPLLHGPFADACLRISDTDVHTAQCTSHTLQAFAAESELTGRLAKDGGGGALKLACALAARCHDAHTRAASIETIAAAAEDPETCWRLVGLGALRSLTLAAAVPDTPGQPPVAQLAQRALQCLHYEEFWKNVPECDPLAKARTEYYQKVRPRSRSSFVAPETLPQADRETTMEMAQTDKEVGSPVQLRAGFSKP